MHIAYLEEVGNHTVGIMCKKKDLKHNFIKFSFLQLIAPEIYHLKL